MRHGREARRVNEREVRESISAVMMSESERLMLSSGWVCRIRKS
jgi:hypothetical protein